MKHGLGKRIRFFRKRANLTQLQLEVELGASSGAVSRIENNQINPTKETIHKIAKVLELNNREIDYLIGQTALPATEEEIEKAKEEAEKYLSKRGRLAYLLDDRWRFIMISPTFRRLLKIKPSEEKYVLGKTTAHVIVDQSSPVLERINQDLYTELLENYLKTYYSRVSFMVDDAIYQETLQAIMQNPLAEEIWTNLVSQDFREVTTIENRNIDFDLHGIKLRLYYILSLLEENDRFELVEFSTENKFLDCFSYLI